MLLIDLDPQAHLTLSLGIKHDSLHRSVSDALLANISVVSASRESTILGLDIVPANQELAQIDKLLYGRAGYEFHLRNRLAAMNGELYDFVLIDCPPAVGTLTLNALTAAQRLIIPVQCEYYAAHSLRHTVALAKLIRQKTNPQLTYHLLVTMYDRRNRISRLILEQLQREVNGLLYKTIIEVDTKLRESPVVGQPITRYAPATRGALQYRALAKELIAYE